MDDPAIAEADHRSRALAPSRRINTISRTAARITAGVVSLILADDGHPSTDRRSQSSWQTSPAAAAT
jgi:hypothetical protein